MAQLGVLESLKRICLCLMKRRILDMLCTTITGESVVSQAAGRFRSSLNMLQLAFNTEHGMVYRVTQSLMFRDVGRLRSPVYLHPKVLNGELHIVLTSLDGDVR